MEVIVTIGLSCVLGITMKTADLCDEHGCHFFRGDRIIFGLLWGLAAIALIRVDNALSVIWIAIVLSFIARTKIDYTNHGIATLAILLDLIYRMSSQPNLLSPSTVTIVALGYYVIGHVHDVISTGMSISSGVSQEKSFFLFLRNHELLHTLLAYSLIPLVISIWFSNWLVLESTVSFGVSYELCRSYGPKLARRERLEHGRR